MRSRERLDRFARSLKPLPESGGLQVEGIGRFRGGQIQDFAEHVGESMWPVQTLQHAQGASDLHLLREHRPLVIRGPFWREALGEVLCEGRETELLTLGTALLDVE